MHWLLNLIKNMVGGTSSSAYHDINYQNAGEDVRPYTINEEWKAACDAVLENDDE